MTRTFCDSCGKEEINNLQSNATTENRFSHLCTMAGCGKVMVQIVLCLECANGVNELLGRGGKIRWLGQ